MSHRLRTVSVLLLASILCSGCIYSREIARTRRDIERQYPEAQFDRQVVLNLGPGSLRFLGWVTGLVQDEEAQMARDYLRTVSRVKVGVYDVRHLPSSLADFDLPRLERLQKGGWELALKAKEEDQVVWVMYRARREAVRDLYIFVLDEEELVLARIRGRLNQLLEQVMQDHTPITSVVDFD